MEDIKYRVRIPSKIINNKYYTRRNSPKQISSYYYELYIRNIEDLTNDEFLAIIDKLSTVGGVGAMTIIKLENNEL